MFFKSETFDGFLVAWGWIKAGELRCAIVQATEAFRAWLGGDLVLRATEPLFSSLMAFDQFLLLKLNSILWESRNRSDVTVRDVRAKADLNITAHILELDFLGKKSLELHIGVRKI